MIGARATFCAAHKLPQHPQLHGHSYEVWAYTDAGVDAEEWQKKLQRVCGHLDHTTLTPELSTMEAIAKRTLEMMTAKRVRVVRPVEGLCAEIDSF